MFGRHERDFSYEDDVLTVRIDRSREKPHYVRKSSGSGITKMLSISSDAAIIINPVEPVNLPVEITHHLEIVFPPIIIQPGSERTINLKFPVEIGVFLQSAGDVSVFDIFSLSQTRYSLYGKPVTGLITRFYQSDAYDTIPSTDPYREGVITLAIKNTFSGTVEISRAVFECHTMKIFFGTHVGMNATMQIFSTALALTSFSDKAPEGCPYRAIDLYSSRKLPIIQEQGFFMESGVA